MPFGQMFDVEALKKRMKSVAYFVPHTPNVTGETVKDVIAFQARRHWHWYKWFDEKNGAVDRLKLDCPLWAIDMTKSPQYRHHGADRARDQRAHARLRQVIHMFWRLNSVLTYSKPIRAPASTIISKLHNASVESGADSLGLGYVAVHARVESDWVAYCAKMTELNGAKKGKACFGDVQQLPQMLASRAIPTTMPVYIATGLSFKELEGVAALKPLATPGKPYFASAGELVAHAYLDQDKRAEAGALFAQIAKDQTAPESVRSRARQMAGVLGVDAIEDVEALLAEQGVERESAAGEDAAVATE